MIDTTGVPDVENQLTKQDRRFLVEMAAEMAVKIDTSIPEGAEFRAAFDKLMEAADAYFASIRRE